MKVSGTRSAAAIGGSRAAPDTVAGGFAPDGPEAPASVVVTHTGALGGVNSLEALLALQETLGPLERRRRAVRRAGALLDALDDLKLEVIDGVDDGTAISRLDAAVQAARERTDDPGLEQVLEQVEVRAAVELAKREVAARAGT